MKASILSLAFVVIAVLGVMFLAANRIVDTLAPLTLPADHRAITSKRLFAPRSTPTPSLIMVYPTPTGSFAVGRTEFAWTDANREEIYTADPTDHRQLLVTVWYPASAEGRVAPLSNAQWLPPKMATKFASIIGIEAQGVVGIQVHAVENAPLAQTESPFPILIMSHADGAIPALYTAYAEEFASHGYVVLGVAHPFNAAVIEYPNGREVTTSPDATADGEAPSTSQTLIEQITTRFKRSSKLVTIQAADIRFIIDQVAALNAGASGATDPNTPRFTGKLDLTKIGAVGHSLGGATAIEAILTDPRIGAAVDLDGTVFSDGSSGCDRPTMMIMSGSAAGTTGSSDSAIPPELQSLSASDLILLDKLSNQARKMYEGSQQAAYITINGMKHLNFSDIGLIPALIPAFSADLGSIDPKRGLEITEAYMLAFFDQTLRKAQSALGEVHQRYAESSLQQKGLLP